MLHLCFKETQELNSTKAFHTKDFVAHFVLAACRNTSMKQLHLHVDFLLSAVYCFYVQYMITYVVELFILNTFRDVQIEYRV